jgi:AGZA family xanthine/uracil permease-like MFS transporter
VLGAIAALVIERELAKAAAFALAGAVLTFFGFMHGEQIGLGRSLPLALSYVAFAAVLFACARFAQAAPAHAAAHREPDEHEPALPATA